MEPKIRPALAPTVRSPRPSWMEAVLEYVQGMSVVKSFNLTGRGDHTLQEALEYNCRSNLNIEKMFTPLYHGAGDRAPAGKRGHDALSGMVLSLRDHDLANALMVVIMSFLVLLRSPRRAAACPCCVSSAAAWPMPMRRTPCPSWQRPVGPARPGSTALPSTMFRSLMTSGPSAGCILHHPGQNHHRHRGPQRLRENHTV